MNELIATVAGVCWRARRERLRIAEADALFGPGGLRLDEWLASGAAEIVKDAPHRTVWRVRLPGIDVHVKYYPENDGRARLRRLARGSKAWLEHERTRALAARGVPTYEALAVGETAAGVWPRAAWFVTRTLADTVPLSAFLDALPEEWDSTQRARFRQRLARALGRLVAQMHDAGVHHRDLHPGNVLLHLGADGEPRLYLIDLLLVHLGGPLAWPAAQENLALLNRWFQLRAGRTDRLRFWRAYRAARVALPSPGPAPCEERQQVLDLERATRASNLRLWRSADRRSMGNNRYFRRFRHADLICHAVADLDTDALATILADPDAPFHQPGVKVLKASGASVVAELDLPGPDGPRRVVYKRFASSRPLASLVRPTQALRSWQWGHGLRLRCLPTPRPLAVWHRVRAGLPREGYLLTEKVPDALDLRAFVAFLSSVSAAERQARLRRLIDRVANLLSQLHQRRVSHRDLKAPNLLVSPVAPVITSRGIAPLPRALEATGDDAVWFIDLVGARQPRRLCHYRRVLDLARLSASFYADPRLTRTDRLRFLRTYLHWGVHGPGNWKRWWRELETVSKVKVLRNLRKGRPLG